MQILLNKLSQRGFDKIVVTDRYPPNAHGGAEQSLHILLSQIKERHKLLVVSYSEHISAAREYMIDGVQVLELPMEAPWPFHMHSMKRLSYWTAQSRVKRVMIRLLMLLNYFLFSNPMYLFQRMGMIFSVIIPYFSTPQGGYVNDFDVYPSGLRVRQLRKVLHAIKPRLIHADNYRSILTVSSLRKKTKATLIGLVRDNRFTCVHHSQSMSIANTPCGICNMECARYNKNTGRFAVSLMRLTQTYRQKSLCRLDHIIVTSAFLYKQISSFKNKAAITQLSNAPDHLDKIEPAMQGVAELPGNNILVVGMLNENKGQIPLVKALPKLLSDVPDAKIYFAGRGNRIEKRIYEIAEQGGFRTRVEVLGYLERMSLYKWMRRCQIIALPTLWQEPFGRVPLESGIAMRPIVAYATGGLRESIVDGKTGILVEHNNIIAFTKALAYLCNDPQRARDMGHENKKHILYKYKTNSIAEKLDDLWRREIKY